MQLATLILSGIAAAGAVGTCVLAYKVYRLVDSSINTVVTEARIIKTKADHNTRVISTALQNLELP